jgi:hypothetical protein
MPANGQRDPTRGLSIGGNGVLAGKKILYYLSGVLDRRKISDQALIFGRHYNRIPIFLELARVQVVSLFWAETPFLRQSVFSLTGIAQRC